MSNLASYLGKPCHRDRRNTGCLLALAGLLLLALALPAGAAATPASSFVGDEVVSAGGAHTCAIQSDGGLACWGDNSAGQLDGIPSGEFVAVSAGGNHSCAIRVSGTLACWGSGPSGRLDSAPPGEFVAVSAGADHTCGLRADGRAECWGDGSRGQLVGVPTEALLSVSAGGDSACGLRTDATAVCWGSGPPAKFAGGPGDDELLSIDVGADHSCAIRADGTLTCWGADDDEQLEGIPAGQFRSVSAGGDHSCAIRADGEQECWGLGFSSGQLDTPRGHLRTVSAGGAHSCAVRMDGEPVCWGNDALGQLGIDPAHSSFGSLRVAIGNSSNYTCAIRLSGEPQCLGADSAGNPIEGILEAVGRPDEGIPVGKALAISGQEQSTCALVPSDELRCWGQGASFGSLGQPPDGKFRALSAAAGDTCAIRIGGELSCWATGEPHLLAIPAGRFRAVSGGNAYACAIAISPHLECWGQPGLQVPATVPTGRYREVASGDDRACAIDGGGLLECWGAAAQVPAGTFRSVAADGTHACAIRTDGELACWEGGQALPVPEGTYRSVASGPRHDCAVSGSGALSCWGDNEYGQIQPHFLDVDPPDAVIDAPYAHRIDSTFQEPHARFTLVGGHLPDGIVLSANGVLSGTPTHLGASTFSVSATNGLTGDIEHEVTLKVVLPPPVAGQSFNLEPVDGTTATKCAGEGAFSKLQEPKQVTLDCQVDTRRGTVSLTASKGSSGETQSALFWGGLFNLDQKAGDNQAAVLGLSGRLRCEKRTSKGRRTQKRSRKGGGGRKLWGSGGGNYKTVGSHGAATVRGTIWLVADRCDGSTKFKVKRGTVVVRDFVKKSSVVLNAGESYIAKVVGGRLP